MAKIAIVGAGHVGLVTGVALARDGQEVTCADVDSDRISLIQQGVVPFHEPGLSEGLRAVQRKGLFEATTDSVEAVGKSDYAFLCVGTPSTKDGAMNAEYLRAAAHDIAMGVAKGTGQKAIVLKSTVVPGTTEGIIRPIILETADKDAFLLAVSPEFLREGRALADAENPDRIVIGAETKSAARRVRSLYSHLGCPIIETDTATAEMIKLAANAFLATKVGLANELANLCDTFGVSYDQVISAVTLDKRLNPSFLVPGVGFGGSCLPKDVRMLIGYGTQGGYKPRLLEAVLAQNEVQYMRSIDLLEEELTDLRGKRIALLGLAFKGGTDDVRESRAIPIAETLLAKGASVVGYDGLAHESFLAQVPEVEMAYTIPEALSGSHGCIIQADLPELEGLTANDFLRTMQIPIVIDGRSALDPQLMDGIRYRRIG